MPRKVFVAGEILTAADVNTNLMDQSVMVFDDATARSTAIPTPVEGMVTYLKDEDEVTVFDGSAFKAVGPGKILQVVSTAKTDTFSTASTSFTAITGLTATITPSSATSKVLISAQINFSHSNNFQYLRLSGGNTSSFLGDAAGSRRQVAVGGFGTYDQATAFCATLVFLDSPSTTSSVTYGVQGATNSGTLLINRSPADTDNGNFYRSASSITVMEVAG